jgi:tetratricopeptide (TPR) repeat protein
VLNVLNRPDIRRLIPSFLIAAVAAVGIGFAPMILNHNVQTPAQNVAPVKRDYLQRDAMVAFLEKQVKVDPADQITLRMLSAQYMQRFRERYDLTDIARAAAAARRSLVLQPQGNTAALMELGRYDEARSELALIVDDAHQEDPTVDAVRARLDELSGRLEEARGYISRAIATTDSISENPAYDRSWFHMRAAQLAFEDGDARNAETDFATALQLFPDNSMALMFEAKMFRAQGRWQEALTAATHSADLYPLPQALGYEADAQRARPMR